MKKTRSFKFESLENRQLMAGDVSVYIDYPSRDLYIVGDSQANHLELSTIPGAFGNMLRIEGESGTTVRRTDIRSAFAIQPTGRLPVVELNVSNFNNVIVKLGDGDDYLESRRGLELPNDLNIDAGRGADRVALLNVEVGDDLSVFAGWWFDQDRDEVVLYNVRLTPRRYGPMARGQSTDAMHSQLRIETGAGDDRVSLQNVSMDRHELRIDTQTPYAYADADTVSLVNVDSTGLVGIYTGNANDTVSIRNSSLFETRVNTSWGDDKVEIYDTLFKGDSSIIASNISSWSSKTDSDTVIMENVSTVYSSDMWIKMQGLGVNSLTIRDSLFAADLDFTGGDNVDRVLLEDIEVRDDLTVKTGGGADVVTLGNLDVGGDAEFDLGDDYDVMNYKYWAARNVDGVFRTTGRERHRWVF